MRTRWPGRIAFFMHGFELGGAQKMTLALAEELTRRGFEVDVVVAKDEGALRGTVADKVRVVVLRSWLLSLTGKVKRRTRVRAAIPALARYVRAERPAMLVGAANHASIATVLAHLLARRSGVGLVLRATNPLAPGEGGGSTVKRAIARLLFPRAHRIVAVSEPVRADHGRVLGLPMERVALIPEPVLGRDFASRLAAPPFHPWIAQPAPLVISIGRLVRQKDYPTLLRAWAFVQRERPDARLLIIGDGPERAALVALRDALGSQATVAFAGAVDNPLPALRYARCLALSSRWEGLGIVAVEALAAGCKVVATDTPAVRWALGGGRLGLLSPVGDAPALAASILQSLDAPASPDQVAGIEPFRLETAARRYRDLFATVLGNVPTATASLQV